ncbi:MAG: ABC transporter ATP-binding protein [Candidatus Bathyarchaeota archaeon]|nr:ABC transporter ATP-binding protein [Candidatus Bathyarchaeota archaeon]
MSEVIKTQNLTKRFGKVTAVDRLSITLNGGEIYGFLGLNGAGKTTTIRMLLGMISPTDGSVSLFGERVSHGSNGLWSRVGYLVERPSAYPELTVRENLEVARRLHIMQDHATIDAVIERLGLAEFADRRAQALSTGNLQRLGLAKALINEPELLILDEPSNGLDPAGIVEVREMLLGIVKEGTTVFMSSHILSEVNLLATRIGIIHGGLLLEEIDAAELERRARKSLVIQTRDNEAALRYLVSTGLDVSLDGEITVHGQDAVDYPDRIASLLVNAGHPPMSLRVEQPDLEAHFLQLVESKEAV